MKKVKNHYRFYGLLPRMLAATWLVFAVYSVQAKDLLYSFQMEKASALLVMTEIEKKTNLKFAYNPLEVDVQKEISFKMNNQKLEIVLSELSKAINIKYSVKGETVVLQPETTAMRSNRQQGIVKGKVSEQNGTPLAGVVVTNTTQSKSVATNGSGEFTINAQSGDILTFKMIGFEDKSHQVASLSSSINIILSEGAIQLNTTVVTALGIKREEKSLGYSVSEVDGEGLKKARETNVINSLAGKVAGLVVNSTAGGPAGSSRVIIRGNTTVTGNNQPLYVVDGVPIDNSNYGDAGNSMYAQGYDFGDAISAINPDDIDKISVLKGPSASALYGTRAANGVILITTKKGTGSKSLGIEVNSTTSFESQLTKFDGYQQLYGQGRSQNINRTDVEARGNMFHNFGGRLDPDLMVVSFDGVYRPYGLVKDNISGFFRTGSTYTNNIALTNSNDVTSYRFSYTNLTNNDIVPKSGMNRNSFSFNGSSKFGSKLTMEAKAFYMNEKVDNRPALADDAANIGQAFIGLANNIDQSLFMNNYKNADGSYIEWGGGQFRINPYWVLNEMKNETIKNRYMTSIQLNYEINDWINIQGRISNDLTFMDFDKFSPRTTPGNIPGTLDQIRRKYRTTEADVLATFQKQVSPSLNLSARLGGSISRAHNDGQVMQFTDMTALDAISPSSFVYQSVVPSLYKRHLNSMYGLFSAGFKNYLYLDASIRQDASSTLPQDKNSYIYPSVSTSFVFTDAFKMDQRILSFGKFRMSAAEVAGDTDPFLLDLYYSLHRFSFNGVSIGGANTGVLPNRNLRPTRTRSYEVGTELKFFNGRLNLDATYYTQRSRDQINRVPIPASSGFTTQNINAGVVSNKGLELMISGTAIDKKDFQWNMGFNFARNINRVESLAKDVPYLSLSDARWMDVSVVAMPNASYGAIMSYDYVRDPNGNIVLDNKTFKPVRSAERTLIGKGIYSWTGGMTNSFTYKNFTLNTLLDVKYGADLFSITNLTAATRGSADFTLEGREEWIRSEEQRLAEGYTPVEWNSLGRVQGFVPKGVIQNEDGTYTPNTTAVDPSVYWAQINADGVVARPFIYDASYVKMREITLAYRLPNSLIRKWGVRDAQIALVSRNPFIIYKNVPNIDPDSNYSNGNGQGIEYGSLPTRKSWGFNLNFRF